MPGEPFHFSPFELDAANCQLRRSGRAVPLQKIPLQLLLLLVERNGKLVTRAEIVEKIWGKGAFLDSESAISTAIRKVRRALGDDAAQPKYIETVPAKG
jgi:DNA-binding winged helix-turn-helix (wHTH) protein